MTITCDGACRPNPGAGGWGVVIVENGAKRELSGGFRKTTNNRMEIVAVIEGLRAAPADAAVTVVSDSRYVVDMLNGGHARRWNVIRPAAARQETPTAERSRAADRSRVPLFSTASGTRWRPAP